MKILFSCLGYPLDELLEIKCALRTTYIAKGYSGYFGSLMKYISQKEKCYKFKLILWESAREYTKDYKDLYHKDLEIIYVSAQDITSRFESWDEYYRYLEINSTVKEKYDSYYRDLLREKLGKSFAPDFVYGLWCHRVVEVLNSTRLAVDRGIFADFPFSDSSRYFVKVHEYRYLNKFLEKIKNRKLEADQQVQIDNLTRLYSETLISLSPFKEKILKYRESFKYICLLPLSLGDLATYKTTQVDYLFEVLPKIGDNIGVIITFHPSVGATNKEEMFFLSRMYKNVILDDEFLGVNNCSKLIIPFVDGVISENSSAALLGAFLGKPLFSLNKKEYLDYFCYKSNLYEIENSLDQFYIQNKRPNYSKELYYYITRLESRVRNISPEWVYEILKNDLTLQDAYLDDPRPYIDPDSVIKLFLDDLMLLKEKGIPEPKINIKNGGGVLQIEYKILKILGCFVPIKKARKALRNKGLIALNKFLGKLIASFVFSRKKRKKIRKYFLQIHLC